MLTSPSFRARGTLRLAAGVVALTFAALLAPHGLADGKGSDIGGPEREHVRSDATRFGVDVFSLGDEEKEARLETIAAEYESLKRNQDIVQVRARRNRITFVGEMRFPKAAKFLLGVFNGERDVRAKAASMVALGKCGDPDAIETVVKKVLSNAKKEAVFVAQLGRMFAEVRNEEAAEWIVSRIPQKDARVQAAVVEAVGHGGSPTAIEPLTELIKKSKRPEVRFEALRALGRCGGKEAVPTLLPYLEDTDWRMRMAAVEGLGFTGETAVIDDCARLLIRGEEPVVVETATEAIGRIGGREAVEPLIKSLELARLRARQKARRALVDIARREFRMDKDYHVDPNTWRSWWKKVKKGVDPDDPSMTGRETASYFTFPIHSDRVLFILDVSGSMKWPDAPRISGIKPSEWKGRRIDVAHRELFKALRALAKQNKGRIPNGGGRKGATSDLPYGPSEDGVEPPTLFNVATFAGHIAPWKKEAVIADDANVEAAIEWLRVQFPRGGTNTHGALEFGLNQEYVDTVFFLSDGVPSVGKMDEPEAILAEVRHMNRFRRVTVNTVALIVGRSPIEKALKYEDPEEMADFMNRIAIENYGKFADESRPQ